jgi:hypothetical protein
VRGGDQCKQVVKIEKKAKAFTTLDGNKYFVANKTHVSKGNICAFSDETKEVQSQEPL